MARSAGPAPAEARSIKVAVGALPDCPRSGRTEDPRCLATRQRKIAEAQDLAEMQLAHLRHNRLTISGDEAQPFLAREILRLHREGEQDAQRLADRAISLLREHVQRQESALRIVRPSDRD